MLPFANLSGNADQEYLSDGLTTKMTALLGRLHPDILRVIARTKSVVMAAVHATCSLVSVSFALPYFMEDVVDPGDQLLRGSRFWTK